MTEQRSARKPEPSVLEALVELARSAIRNDREAVEAVDRRRTLRVVAGGRRDAA